ncbi:MAG: hypothetical protein RI973_2432 [Bacteroidota bacterium]
MKKELRHITVLFLAVLMLVTTTGLSVHQLYCYCKGEFAASLFTPEDPCGMSHAVAVKKPKCCKQQAACERPAPTPRKNCADTTTVFVKLDADYLVNSAEFDIQVPAAPLANASSPFAVLPVFSTPACPAEACDLPPPPYGTGLLVRIQSFLC